ncbi:hypothetical protein P691DRAFT_804605 [Macrolepiota fuliginosa MF-IS2]|uniref:DUF7719 domain-containing protein n=1 Tax=Macrolepiota fuliginosa MF-IS2 TaxID=1400762 RepID=A0A9P5XMJ9_9AGAR|nr:hypothetical protein P691DRAFT_804605 [Macrolepiota fuliginosa MF-IS2]
MTQRRKGKKDTSDDVPLVKPSDSSQKEHPKPLVDISEDEQWRLINESGVLRNIPRLNQTTPDSVDSEDPDNPTFGEEIFNTITYLVPFSFLLILMEILIHYQYKEKATLNNLLDRMISGVPIMSILIFYTLRYKSYRVVQILLFAISILAGCRLIYQINNANWLTNMQQAPPLATIWIYAVFMADLGPAVLALLTIGSFVWWKELNIIL